MTQRKGSVAAALVVIVLVVALGATVVIYQKESGVQTEGIAGAFVWPAFGFGLIGALLLWRRPENLVGRLFALDGLLLATGTFTDHYARYVFGTDSELPAGNWAAWYSEWWWIPFLFLTLCFIPMLFPEGQNLPGRWRWLLRFAVFTMTWGVLVSVFDPGLEYGGATRSVDNPIGISPFGDLEEGSSSAFFFLSALVCVLGSGASLVVRFVRSRGTERRQLKLFTYACGLFIVLFVGMGLTDGFTGLSLPPWTEGLIITLPSIGAGAAILRHRLYDIDVIINRTLVYGALTAMLAGAYLGIVVLLQRILEPVTADSDLAIAGSTLAVAALFRPMRSRVQGFIDRRFYRRKYDAAATLEQFSGGLRDQVELESLNRELIGVVTRTVQPSSVSLWLRSGETL
ncbi:MAG: hypothetical protein ACR2KQ_07605 [Actinomycetota bacterium]